MSNTFRKIMYLVFCALGLSAFAAVEVHSGAKVQIGQGDAFVFIELDTTTHVPQTLGIELSGKSLQGLAGHHDQEYTLPMPLNFPVMPYQHVVMDWNPHGHFPDEIYGAPHFDFHFYLISPSDRAKIICDENDAEICLKMPLEEEVAPFYVPAPDGVAKMGWHWVDSRAPELNGKTFKSTFIYGYYDGQLIFLEPMMTRKFLLSKAHFSKTLSQPAQVRVHGYYPAKYGLIFDSPRDVFQVTLQKLTWR
jgi:hypothetical protein